MSAYYNEHDRFAAAWLRELISAGLIAPGFVDERDIQDVQPSDLAGYAQCHFFAGIGGWSLALRLAGVGDDEPFWSGSCPCQPFSSAGKGEGFNDSRHLWPAWFRLIRERRPATLFGEQVASGDGLAWFDTVSTDLEAEAYAVGAADLCAAGVGAPHLRQRLYFVGHANVTGREGRIFRRDSADEWATRETGVDGAMAESGCERIRGEGLGTLDREARGMQGTNGQRERIRADTGAGSAAAAESVADAASARPAWPEQRGANSSAAGKGLRDAQFERNGDAGGMADADGSGQRSSGGRVRHERDDAWWHSASRPWSELTWLYCRDGKLRPTKPGLSPLAARVPGRMGIIRGAGNSICPQVAAQFIKAALA